MQNSIVLIVLAIAAFYVSMIIYRALKKGPDCGSGCSTCNLADSCEDPQKSENPIEKEET